MTLLDEFTRALIQAAAFGIVSLLTALTGLVFTLWLDVRSLKKAMRSVFKKVRDLEKWTVGEVTSELEARE